MVLEEYRLEGRAALVTGGGRGIGSGIACGLAEAGADIACVYAVREPEEVRTYVESLGRRFVAIRADVARPEELPGIVEKTVGSLGRLDILVNNAGIARRAPLLDYTEEMWDQVINVDEKSVFLLSRLAVRQFLKQGTGGRIINLASMVSYLGGVNCGAYTAAKHAVMGLTKLMASEWGPMGINVNAIAPGYVVTELNNELLSDEDRRRAIDARLPLGRWAGPEDFKGVAVLLSSEAGRYINGVTIPVDGGYLTR
ncbi:MAG: SDR family oxidoreductase [Oscillospiraceae bacterium]|nr:SDR family oxidoreductase [Oscillospiraceae bacterium]